MRFFTKKSLVFFAFIKIDVNLHRFSEMTKFSSKNSYYLLFYFTN